MTYLLHACESLTERIPSSVVAWISASVFLSIIVLTPRFIGLCDAFAQMGHLPLTVPLQWPVVSSLNTVCGRPQLHSRLDSSKDCHFAHMGFVK
jgi:hypothetical protein